MFCGWFSSSTTDRDVSEQGFPEDLPPADGQVHREESHLGVCVGVSVCACALVRAARLCGRIIPLLLSYLCLSFVTWGKELNVFLKHG